MKIDLEKGIYIGIILMGVIVLVAYKVKRRKERNQDFPRLNEIDDDTTLASRHLTLWRKLYIVEKAQMRINLSICFLYVLIATYAIRIKFI